MKARVLYDTLVIEISAWDSVSEVAMKKMRVQFDMPQHKLDELQELMDEAGFETRRELFNNALSLLEWAVDQKKKGRTVGSINEDEQKYSELIMPFLQNLERRRA